MFLAAALLAVNVLADPIEIELTKLEVEDYGADKYYVYSNSDYKVTLDIYTTFPWVAGTTYGLANVDPEYTKVIDVKTSRSYACTELEFVLGENLEDVEVTTTGKYNNPGTGVDEFISIHAVYVKKEMTPIDLALYGECEFIDLGSMQIYQFTAATAMGDAYSVDIPVLAAELVSGTEYSIANGTIHNSANITTPSGKVTLSEAALTLTYLDLEESYLLMGTMKDANGQEYNVQILSSLPAGPETVELSFYNTVLSEDEGDIKFKYQDDEYQLICYLSPKEGDDLSTMTLVGGEYNVLSYSKFGMYDASFGMYMADALADAHASVEVTEEATVLTLTFSQNGDDYAITASTADKSQQSVELTFTTCLFEDKTYVEETEWTKKSIKFQGYTEDEMYKATFEIYTDHVAGEYSIADCNPYNRSIVNRETWENFDFSEGKLVVAVDGNVYTLEGELLYVNEESGEETAYTVHMSYTKPEQVEITIAGAVLSSYPDWENPSLMNYSLAADGTDYSVQLSFAVEGELVDGDYELGEYDNVSDNVFWNSVSFVEGSKVNVKNETAWNGDACIVVTGEVMGLDGVKYVLNLTNGLPSPDHKYELVDQTATVTCQFRENGSWDIEGVNEQILVHLQLSAEYYEGSYNMDSWNFGYNNYLVVNEQPMEIGYASVDVVEKDGNVELTGWAMAVDGVTGESHYVTLALTGEATAEPAAEGDNTEKDIEVRFTEYELSEDWMWGGAILDATNEDGYSLHVVFSEPLDEEGKLVQGVCVVTNDWESPFNRITPSTAMEGGEGPMPLSLNEEGDDVLPNGSYVADAEGNFWFIYNGGANISYDENGELLFELDALNTAGKSIIVTVSAPEPEGVRNANINSMAIKQILNGQVVIIRDNKTYNLMGVQM